jgi:hypothetical protein
LDVSHLHTPAGFEPAIPPRRDYERDPATRKIASDLATEYSSLADSRIKRKEF